MAANMQGTMVAKVADVITVVKAIYPKPLPDKDVLMTSVTPESPQGIKPQVRADGKKFISSVRAVHRLLPEVSECPHGQHGQHSMGGIAWAA